MSNSEGMRSTAASSGLAGLIVGASVTALAISIPTVLARLIRVAELPSAFMLGLLAGTVPAILLAFGVYVYAQIKLKKSSSKVPDDA